MSGYLSHFLGYVLKLFKKENRSRRNDRPSTLLTPRRCKSVIYDRDFQMQMKTVTTDFTPTTQTPNLQRYNSCPQIDKDEIAHATGEPQWSACSDKLIIAGLAEYNLPVKTDQHSQHTEYKDLKSHRYDLINMDGKEDFRTSYPSTYAMGGGDGKDIPHQSFKEDHELQCTQKTNRISEMENNRTERLLKTNATQTCSAKEDLSATEWEFLVSNGKNKQSNEEPSLCDSYYFDAVSSLKQELRKADPEEEFSKLSSFGEENISLGTLRSTIPEYRYFHPLLSIGNRNKELLEEQFENDIRNHQMFSTLRQDRRLSCKSKIPIHQKSRRFSEGDRFVNDVQSGWRRSSRVNVYDRNGRNWTSRGICRMTNFRHSRSSTSIAYRSLLNVKFDRMFRQFSKKIYRFNIIDHNSHSRWIKLAGIVEEENAFNFKSYAKSKVVLTLAEYKEALLKMCEDNGLDYWEVLKKMTDVKSRGETHLLSAGVKDESQVQVKEEQWLEKEFY